MKKYLLLLLLVVPLVSAYQLEYTVESTNVLTILNIQSKGFDYELPADYKTLTLKQDNQKIEPEIIANILKVPKGNIELSFITKTYLEKGKTKYFVTETELPEQKNSIIKLYLPQEATLDESFPKQTNLETNGKQIILVWKTDKNIILFVKYNERKKYELFIIPLVVLILILLYFLRKKPKIIKKTKTITAKAENYLKDDEKKIISALKKKQGECEQATLRIITDFSKAHLSRLLMELEQRNLIKKIKKGKKNIIRLK